MGRRARLHEIDEASVEVHRPRTSAAGPEAVAVSLKRAVEHMGPVRSARALLRLNQVDGFDCQGCAWPDPDPDHRHTAEFCENGAKAVSDEATTDLLEPSFFAEHPVAELAEHTDYWLNQQGRITEPYVLREGRTHYEPVTWEAAFALMARHLRGINPDEAIFYTSGKVSNEAAYLYQLFARAYGTNNLPDCSNMCHESTSVALQETIGIGKGSVTLEDVHEAELIVILGQNPGTNHPRMLSALEKAKQRGARIIAVNPLKEAGLIRFRNPQTPRGVAGRGTGLADLYLQIRGGGDLALLQSLAAHLVEWDALDHDFLERHTTGFDEYAAALAGLDRTVVDAATGLSRAEVEEAARMLAASSRTVFCWAMGITQHRHAVATIKEIANLAFLQGNIGKPGAGLCPVRGHSNVQGDRTMGIWERVPPHFLDLLRDEFGFEPPREHGFDTVAAVKALRDRRAKVFVGLGGNFVSAAPDTSITEDALRSADLTVHVSTKLNRSHVVHGREALILPALGRSERDLTGGKLQRVTVEDSMSSVHASHGPLKPASRHLRSEVDIVCSLAEAVLADGPNDERIPWADFRADYAAIRRSIARVVPGCAAYEEKVGRAGGFVLPTPAARRAGVHRPTRARPSSPSARSRCCRSPTSTCCCRPCAPTTSSTPRSTGSATDTAASRAAAGSSSRTPTTSPRSGSRPATSWTWSARGKTGRSGRRRCSGWCRTTCHAAARRRTTRRPTRSCRSATPPMAATSRRTRRSRCASSAPTAPAPRLRPASDAGGVEDDGCRGDERKRATHPRHLS